MRGVVVGIASLLILGCQSEGSGAHREPPPGSLAEPPAVDEPPEEASEDQPAPGGCPDADARLAAAREHLGHESLCHRESAFADLDWYGTGPRAGGCFSLVAFRCGRPVDPRDLTLPQGDWTDTEARAVIARRWAAEREGGLFSRPTGFPDDVFHPPRAEPLTDGGVRVTLWRNDRGHQQPSGRRVFERVEVRFTADGSVGRGRTLEHRSVDRPEFQGIQDPWGDP